MACALGGGQNGRGEDLGGLPALIDICEQVAESLSAFRDEGAEGASVVGLDRQSIEAHLAVCTYCGALRPRGSAVPKEGTVPPPGIWEGIESVLREEGLIRD